MLEDLLRFILLDTAWMYTEVFGSGNNLAKSFLILIAKASSECTLENEVTPSARSRNDSAYACDSL